jgi:hypothetical protein
LTVFPCTRETVDLELVEYLAEVFNEVVQEGRTYPQKEKLSLDEFVSPNFVQDRAGKVLLMTTAFSRITSSVRCLATIASCHKLRQSRACRP